MVKSSTRDREGGYIAICMLVCSTRERHPPKKVFLGKVGLLSKRVFVGLLFKGVFVRARPKQLLNIPGHVQCSLILVFVVWKRCVTRPPQ